MSNLDTTEIFEINMLSDLSFQKNTIPLIARIQVMIVRRIQVNVLCNCSCVA